MNNIVAFALKQRVLILLLLLFSLAVSYLSALPWIGPDPMEAVRHP